MPGNNIISHLIRCFWRDPGRREDVLPRGLCELLKQKQGSNTGVGICSAHATQPCRSWQGHRSGEVEVPQQPQHGAMAAHGPTPSHLPFLYLLIKPLGSMGWSTKRNDNHCWPQSLRPKQKRGRAVLKKHHKSWDTGERQVPEGSTGWPVAHELSAQRWVFPWKPCTHAEAARQGNNSPPSAVGTSCCSASPSLWMHLLRFCNGNESFSKYLSHFDSWLTIYQWNKYLRRKKQRHQNCFNYKGTSVELANQSTVSSKLNPRPSWTPANSKPSQKHLPSLTKM